MKRLRVSNLLLHAFAAVATLSVASSASAATYYVATSGNDSAAGSKAAPFLTLQKGISVLAPGDSLMIGDGTYAGASNAITNIPNGSAGSAVTIAAENEGNVIVTGGLVMDHTNSFITIQGLRIQDASGRVILGNHLKFFRNEFKGGCANGNCAGTAVGTNDFNDTADILLEDNWFHGAGGRYNLLVYNSNRVVVRRAVIRHDAGWTDTKGDPEAGINFYNSSNCSAENIVVLDNTLTYHTWQGAIYNVYNTQSPNATNNNSWYGDIALNGRGAGLILDGDGPQAGHTVKDLVTWDVDYGLDMGTGSCDVSGMTIDRVTVGRAAAGPMSLGIVQYAKWSGTVTNAIVTNSQLDFDGVAGTYFDTFGNQNSSAGVGVVTYDPRANGLMYLTRIEPGTPLKTAGSSGGQIGAQIVNRIGAAGTLYGETGWNVDTGVPLWPFPHQARIKKEMCTDAGVTRGFCSSPSLTDYINAYLGNPNPYLGCQSDIDCGGATSGLVCAATDHICESGCRGMGGNGCPTGQACSSNDASVGTCTMSTGTSSSSTASAGSTSSGAGGNGAASARRGGGCACSVGAEAGVPSMGWFAGAVVAAALGRSGRRRRYLRSP